MNQDNDRLEATEVDPQVSANYESLADEKTPTNLDKAVLREAARAVRADIRRGSFGAWFRPVAFMATVGLSLAIILDLSDTTIFSPPVDTSVESTAPAPAAIENAADAVDKNRAATTVSESADSEQAQLPALPATLAPAEPQQTPASTAGQAVVGDVFSEEAASAEQRIQKLGATASYALQSPTERPASSVQIRQSQALDTAASVADFQVTRRQCLAEEKLAPETWWSCIDSLRQAGPDEFADKELENLRKAFPDFQLPE